MDGMRSYVLFHLVVKVICVVLTARDRSTTGLTTASGLCNRWESLTRWVRVRVRVRVRLQQVGVLDEVREDPL